MKIEPVEIYSEASNLAVMRHPDRRFPGALIQGDSLFALVCEVQELHAAVKASGNEELIAMAEEIKEKLEERLAAYEEALLAHGIELPYRRHASSDKAG